MITTILIFIFVLGLLVFVHELGHFTMAKAFGMGVDEFGFGFPPRIAGIKKGGTLYSINWIPLGGFVKIHGENGMIPIDEMIVNYKEKGKANINEKELKEETKFISNLFPEFSLKKPSYEDLADFLKNKKDHLDKTAFYTKPIWQRFIVLIAGVFMNVVLCAILLSVGYMIGFPSALENLPANARVSDENIVVLQIEEGLPAQNAGLAEGDIIISANNQELTNVQSLRDINTKNENIEIIYSVEREGETIDISIKPTILEAGNVGIGAYLTESGIVKLPWYSAIWTGIKQTWFLIQAIFIFLIDIIKDAVTEGTVDENISGPVGIAVLAGRAANMGFIYVLQFTALLSINLAIFNLLPLPALDGGRIIFLIIEKIRKKPVNQKIENLVHTVGFASLLILLALVTFRDINKFNIFGQFKDLFL